MADRQLGTPQKAVIYARISRDGEGEGLGVERQIEDCQKLAKRLGYEVIEVFEDNDISASTRSKKVRPAYNDMLAMARAEQIDAILAYSNSRLTRRVREYLDLIDLVVKHGVLIRTAVSGEFDLSTADGRAVALTLATWDQAEAERTSERVKRAKQQMADRGEYRGGRRPFGFEKGGVRIKESEAAVIRKATSEVIAGRSLRSIVTELNEAGVKTSAGNAWDTPAFRDVLMRPRNMGHLGHGQIGREGWGIGEKAIWEPIVDEDTWRALYEVLTAPERKTTTNNSAVHLGSGIYRCGRCGGTLRATRSGRQKKLHYRCYDYSHLLIDATHTDAFVMGELVKAVNDPMVIEALTPRNPNANLRREERRVQEKLLARFERDYAEGHIDGRQLKKATDSANFKIAEIDAELSKTVRRSTSSAVLRAVDPGAALLRAPVDVQRAVLATLFNVKVILASEAGIGVGKAWSSDRVIITPVESEPDPT